MKVLITRDFLSAQATAKLVKPPYHPIVLPMLKVEKVAFKTYKSYYDTIIITSKHALYALKKLKYGSLLQVGKTHPSLYDMLPTIAKLQGEILYLRGEVVVHDIKKINPLIQEVVCYRMIPLSHVIPDFDVVLFYCQQAANLFFDCYKMDLKDKIAIAISQRVASVIPKKMSVIIAAHPNAKAMLECLHALKIC